MKNKTNLDNKHVDKNMYKLITIKDFANELNKPENTIRTWRNRGDIPRELFFEIGKTVFIKLDMFNSWVKNNGVI